MNTEYLEKRDRLNRAMRRLPVGSRSRGDIQGIIELAKQTQYKCLLGELSPSCKIPTKLKEQYPMNLSSQPAPQTRTFQSWRSIFLATILLVTVAITISTFYFSSVQAESHGAITGLTLTSDAPGTLTVFLGRGQPHAHRLPGGLG